MYAAQVVFCGACGGREAPDNQELNCVWVVIRSYNTQYKNGFITEGCTLMEAISADRIHDYKVSAVESTKIATALMSNNKAGTCVISD
jgi:hypothetical protein